MLRLGANPRRCGQSACAARPPDFRVSLDVPVDRQALERRSGERPPPAERYPPSTVRLPLAPLVRASLQPLELSLVRPVRSRPRPVQFGCVQTHRATPSVNPRIHWSSIVVYGSGTDGGRVGWPRTTGVVQPSALPRPGCRNWPRRLQPSRSVWPPLAARVFQRKPV